MAIAAPELLDRIRAVALDEFAERGYNAATLASIAARAGTSKQNVLYHFGTKQALLAAALEPLLDAIGRFDADYAAGRVGDPALAAVDLLVEHDQAIGLVLFHLASLPDHRVAEQAMSVFGRVAANLLPDDPQAPLRVTMALAGLAYVIAAQRLEPLGAVGLDARTGDLADRRVAAAMLRDMIGLAPEEES